MGVCWLLRLGLFGCNGAHANTLMACALAALACAQKASIGADVLIRVLLRRKSDAANIVLVDAKGRIK